MSLLPKARTAEIVVNEFGKELLVYDLITHQAYQLNETSMIIYNACDGKQTFEEFKVKYNYTDEIIYLALDELKKVNLITDQYISPFAGIKRREVIRKVGLASIIALPVISAIVAPIAAHAASGCVGRGMIVSGQPTGACASDDSNCAIDGPQSCCSGRASITSDPCPFGQPTTLKNCVCR